MNLYYLKLIILCYFNWVIIGQYYYKYRNHKVIINFFNLKIPQIINWDFIKYCCYKHRYLGAYFNYLIAIIDLNDDWDFIKYYFDKYFDQLINFY